MYEGYSGRAVSLIYIKNSTKNIAIMFIFKL